MITEPQLDALLHQPIRTRLVAYLASRGETTFTDLRSRLEVTDGNLEAHLKKLVAADYLKVTRQQGHGRPQTLYSLSETGLAAFHAYILALQTIVPELTVDEQTDSPPADSRLSPT